MNDDFEFQISKKIVLMFSTREIILQKKSSLSTT